MGKVTWGGGVTAEGLDSAERNQFRPYDGPEPPNAMFAFKIKKLSRNKTSNGNDQLIIGLELTPRQSRPDDKRYKGYYITDFIVVTEQTMWRVAPFLDAIGVTGRDFTDRTMCAREKDRWGGVEVQKIGKWVNTGNQYVLATLADDTDQNGKHRKKIGSYYMPGEASAAEPDDTDADADEADDDVDDDSDAPF